MKYIAAITLPTDDRERDYLGFNPLSDAGHICYCDQITGERKEKFNFDVHRLNCFSSVYPFLIFSRKQTTNVYFSEVTLLCGSNGCGKSTLLNIIAQKLMLQRATAYNRTAFFDDYLLLCDIEELYGETFNDWRSHSRIITSDDVFDHMLQVREKNDTMDRKRDEMRKLRTMERPKSIDFDNPKSVNTYMAIKNSQRGSFMRVSKKYVGMNPIEFSNGENGFEYFLDAIQPNALYLLDEPENSLSAERQIELKQIIEYAVRYDNCQFIISTHSPFISAINNATIYNLDKSPIEQCLWHNIPFVQTYLNFFREIK